MDEQKEKKNTDNQYGRDLSACILNTNTFTVAGVVIGTLISARKSLLHKGTKDWRSFVVCSSIGAVADIYYGYNYACHDIREKYELAKNLEKK
jgi:hypothetical protein